MYSCYMSHLPTWSLFYYNSISIWNIQINRSPGSSNKEWHVVMFGCNSNLISPNLVGSVPISCHSISPHYNTVNAICLEKHCHCTITDQLGRDILIDQLVGC
uniref:Uncharacterized protein n=1 Tax=Cacopsylla melanoneura TaxID=428564 RepID=A0A8D8SRJ7_9HEMI